MSFSRTRRFTIIADRTTANSTTAATTDLRNHYRSIPYSSSQSTETTSYHRDRPFADSDAGVGPPPFKKRKNHPEEQEDVSRKSSSSASASASASEEGESFMSRKEIDRRSPSRRDGIDRLLETRLRYSYCAYLQSLGTRLQIPQTTIGTAIVLCHRFFLHRSHASHDRFLIATAALFLAAKSEETPCLLNSVLRASCEICQQQNFAFFPYLFSSQDWFEQYRERVTEAEQMILTTLDFELEVQHPYVPLASVLNKLGLQTVLLNLAWNLISEGLRSSLWLQFKPHHIAAGAAYLAARFLNFDLSYYQSIWHEFQTTPYILQDVVQQLKELF